MAFRENLAAIGDYFRAQRKIASLKGQIRAKQSQVREMRRDKAAYKAIEAGQGKAGHSRRAAQHVAEKYR